MLREKREAAGLTQQELAAKSGILQQTISAVESGARPNPTVDTFYRLCRALNCTMDEMYRPDAKAAG